MRSQIWRDLIWGETLTVPMNGVQIMGAARNVSRRDNPLSVGWSTMPSTSMVPQTTALTHRDSTVLWATTALDSAVGPDY